jgi:iron complex outermembrane recepter protein
LADIISSIRRALAAGVLGALGALGGRAALAQQSYWFDLPSQSLADTLRAIGRQANLNILFDPRSVRRRTAGPIHGLFTATEAIDRALAGTRLIETSTDAASVLVRPAPAPHAATAAKPPPPKPPAAPPRRAQPAAALEERRRLREVLVTSSYKQETESSMKMGIPARDTPFSIESYSHSFMKSIETQQVADLYRYMTGLQQAGITGYSLTIRGFSTQDLDRNTFLTDGLPGLAVRFGSPPTIGYDHVELVKGPASLLYGQATPGGFVNIITKKPQPVASTQLEVRGTANAAAYSRVRGADVSFDSTGPLGSDRILYRVIGQISDDRYFRNFSHERGKYLFPMLTVKLGDATTATIQFEYRSLSADYENVGLLAPNTPVAATVAQLAPIQTVYTAPGTSRDERGTDATVLLSHRLAGGGSLNLSARSVDHHDYAYAFDITGFDDEDPTYHTLDLRARGQWNQRTYNFADANAVLPLSTGGLGHRVIVGVDAGKEIDDFRRTQSCNLSSPGDPDANPECNLGARQYTVSLFDPNFSGIPAPGAFGAGSVADNDIGSRTVAAYLSDLMTLSARWKMLIGVRSSQDELSADVNRFDPTLAEYRQTTRTTLPAAGIIYQPDGHWSYYASYGTSYTPVDPSTQAPANAPLFKPSLGKGEEIGAKADFLRHRVNVAGALFLINQTNVLAPYAGGTDALCPTGDCEIQVGAARSKGAELELDAKPSAALTLIAGYAYTDAFCTKSSATGPIVGHQLPNSPRSAAHLWSRYDVLDGALRGFGVGLGLAYVGSRIANTATPAAPGEFVLPAYTVVDLALYREFTDGIDMTVKLDNLFDRIYYQDGAITSGMVSVDAGAPRTAEIYLTWTF